MNYSRQLCEYLLSNKFIKINLNRIGVDYEGLITISYNNLVFSNNFISLYSDLVNIHLKKNYSDTVIVFKDTIHIASNSVLTWRFNLNNIIVKKSPCLKNCAGIDLFLEKYQPKDNITIPILKFPETDTLKEKYKSWVKFIAERFKPKNLCILIFFDINLSSNEKKSKILFINTILEMCTEDTNIYFDKVITLDLLLNCLESSIEKESYQKLNIFLNNSDSAYNFSEDTIVMNNSIERYLSIKSQKKSKICISLEHIENHEELIKFANLLGPYINSVKINSNMIYNDNIINGLGKLSKHHNFLIIDDKKIELACSQDCTGLAKLLNCTDIITIKLVNEEEDLTSSFE